jgi:hypothetical protein
MTRHARARMAPNMRSRVGRWVTATSPEPASGVGGAQTANVLCGGWVLVSVVITSTTCTRASTRDLTRLGAGRWRSVPPYVATSVELLKENWYMYT